MKSYINPLELKLDSVAGYTTGLVKINSPEFIANQQISQAANKINALAMELVEIAADDKTTTETRQFISQKLTALGYTI